MRADDFLKALGCDFFVGVPDSQLKALCDYLMMCYGIDCSHHVIAANEGNCVAIAAGHYLATGNVPVVYMQNSGEGNIINPLASLLDPEVYGIPELFIIGWRGEPGVKDEPQHVKQGQVTVSLLELMGVEAIVVDAETTKEQVCTTMETFRARFEEGKSCAFVVRKGALESCVSMDYSNAYTMTRETAIQQIAQAAGCNPIVSTTGKASRELFEMRAMCGESHERDFLTVGSMGHASSIALGIAASLPNRKIWCIDGDGALLMHMGAMAVVGASDVGNLIHVVINNEAHETVGGMPTVTPKLDLPSIARACGYRKAVSVESEAALIQELSCVYDVSGPSFIEVKCAQGARADLGRPTTTPEENRIAFESFLRKDLAVNSPVID